MSKVVYHGTAGSNLSGILQEFIASTEDKRLGAGYYFTPDKSVAERVATFRRDQNGKPGYAILSFYLDDSNVKQMSGNQACKKWKNEGYDGCTGTHPSWLEFTNGFTEYCIASKSKFKLKDIWVYDAVVDTKNDLFLDHLYMSNCHWSISGNITCKSINI
jgi:hypothetical protein